MTSAKKKVEEAVDPLEAVKKLIMEEKIRLEAELHEIIERTALAADVEKAAEISSYDDHPADMASETFEREKDLALESNVQSLLLKVNVALEKIEEGTYGICDVCGVEINAKRLEALPWASLCRECQSFHEGR